MKRETMCGRPWSTRNGGLRRIAEVLSCALILAFSLIAIVHAKTLTDCAQRSITFDGIRPLAFYRVTGTKNQRLYIDTVYPEACKPGAHDCGSPKAYVLTGDTVAVGEACRAWAYVQFIGQHTITTGWTERSRLAFLRQTSAVPIPPKADDSEIYHFKLTGGEGRPVCEAYLQRLNSSAYPYPPYCNRPEDDAIPGFALLHRVILSPHEISYLSNRVMEFEEHVPQGSMTARNAALVRAGKAPIIPWISEDEVKSRFGVADLYAWRYSPPVDIDNDGTPDNVIVWRSVSATGQCGSESPQGVWLRKLQRIYIVTQGNREIDAVRTAAIFHRPARSWEPYEPFQGVVIGDQLSIIKYRDTYYFDAFFGAEGDMRAHGAYTTVGLFEGRKSNTVQVCQYKMFGAKG